MVRLHRMLVCLVFFAAGFGSAAGAEVLVGGQVVGPDGRALAGIQVGLEPIPSQFDRVETRLGGRMGEGPVVEAATDADGFFELTAPSLGAWKVVVAWGNDGEVAGASPGYVTEEYVLRPLAQSTELPPIRLQRASVVEIEVIDENGRPTDARLAVFDRRRRHDGWRSRQRLARTGEDGAVLLPLGAEEDPQLVVLAANHPIVVMGGDQLAAKNGRVELRLPQGVAGTAVATDRRGHPVAGALAYQGGGAVPLGRTDEEGRLHLVVAPQEREPYRVTFMTRDGLLGHFEPRFSPGAKNEAEVVLEPIATVRGRVVDQESREGVEGAVVWVPGGPVAETDAQGRYELSRFRSSWLTVQAVAKGYAMAYERKPDGADSRDGPTIALAPAATVTGSVVDSEGNPLAGVDISVRPARTTGSFRSSGFRRGAPNTRSTRRGQFFVSGLPPSAGFELVFRKSGFAPSRHEVVGLEAFEVRSGLEVVLGSGASGVGWVVDEAEAAVAGADVRLVPVESGEPRRYGYGWGPENEEDLASSATDAEGHFRFTNLAAGRYNLEVEAAGFAPVTVPGLAVELEPGEQDFGTVVLETGTRLEGIVLDPQGSPVADAEVHAGRQDSLGIVRRTEPVAKSDGSGRFVVADLKAGTRYLVVVAKPGFSSETTSVVAKEGGSVEVVLRPAGTISGWVENEDGDPIRNATVFAEKMEMPGRFVGRKPPRSVTTDEEGTFRLEGVDPGTVQLSVQAPGYQRFEVRDLEVPSSGEVSALDIVLVSGMTIVGTVTRRDGTPVGGAIVIHTAARESSRMFGADSQASGETDGEGRYRIDGVPPGPAVVQAVQGDRQGRASKNVKIGSGTQTVDLTFDDGFQISGRVRDAAGAPVAGAALTLRATGPSRIHFSLLTTSRATTAVDGSFTLEDVAAGHYQLTATKEGYAPAVTPEPFEVSNGPVAGVELQLSRGATLRGRILGLETEDPAAVTVHAFGRSARDITRQGIVDSEGRYSVPNLGPGQWSVMARVETSGRQTSRRVTVDEGRAEAELDLEFKAGYDIQGVVRSTGRPQSGIRVAVNGLEVGLAVAMVVSDSEGRFRFAQLPAGKYRLVAFTAMAQHSREIEVPAEGEVVVELGVLRISGHVRDETGERALPGAAVRIERLETSVEPSRTAYSRSSIETDSRGYFSLSANEGAYRLIVTKAGFGVSETLVEVGAGGGHEGLELKLHPTDGISFDLLLESGVVPAQAMTTVLDPLGRVLTRGYVPVGEAGRVRLSTVPAGTWEIAVQAGDSAIVRKAVTAPGHFGQIRLPRGGSLRIQVPDLAGEQPSLSRTHLAEVRLVGPDGRPHHRLVDTFGGPPRWPVWNGAATVTRLLPGVWTFTVSHPDGRSWTGEAVVTAGETSEVAVP